MGKQRLAVFDFDGTLCSRNSYHVLIRDRARAGVRSCLRIAIPLILRRLRLVSSESFKNIVLSGLCGWPREAVARLGRHLYERELRPFLRPVGIQELNKLRSSGFTPVVVSGAFDFFIHPFCAEYRIDSCFCTRMAFSEETCQGHLDGPEMRGEIKCQALRQHFATDQVAWDESCAFSDEISDLPLLNLVGHAFLVNSSPRVRAGLHPIQSVAW